MPYTGKPASCIQNTTPRFSRFIVPRSQGDATHLGTFALYTVVQPGNCRGGVIHLMRQAALLLHVAG